jgi:hypothetical protein
MEPVERGPTHWNITCRSTAHNKGEAEKPRTAHLGSTRPKLLPITQLVALCPWTGFEASCWSWVHMANRASQRIFDRSSEKLIGRKQHKTPPLHIIRRYPPRDRNASSIVTHIYQANWPGCRRMVAPRPNYHLRGFLSADESIDPQRQAGQLSCHPRRIVRKHARSPGHSVRGCVVTVV